MKPHWDLMFIMAMYPLLDIPGKWAGPVFVALLIIGGIAVFKIARRSHFLLKVPLMLLSAYTLLFAVNMICVANLDPEITCWPR